ncbi:ABC transporter ATP-binding protein [Caldanaerobius polysaccharolyticus]|uniref:ABC transporter ATP-binding protein n=1 Tax=Caldanaerobius polysaccharolyticus TaxID=44256 RepID=UPI00047B217E|nr:ABC transporter ATP-binding protein [Caldanaerobius polysaccharolyticus]
MLKVNNLYKEYKSKKVVALNRINMNVEKNEIVGLLGPNGAGKTTLIKAISGLVNPDSGEIIINDIKLNEKTRRKIMGKLGVVLEGTRNLYWTLSVKDNYYYFASIKGKKNYEIEKNIEKYANVLKTRDFLNCKIKILSTGQKQRVAITAALLHEPELLILDEPSNGLDIESRNLLINGIKYFRDNLKTTFLISSHDVDFISKVVDKIVIIDNGNIVDEFLNQGISPEDIENKYKELLIKEGNSR